MMNSMQKALMAGIAGAWLLGMGPAQSQNATLTAYGSSITVLGEILGSIRDADDARVKTPALRAAIVDYNALAPRVDLYLKSGNVTTDPSIRQQLSELPRLAVHVQAERARIMRDPAIAAVIKPTLENLYNAPPAQTAVLPSPKPPAAPRTVAELVDKTIKSADSGVVYYVSKDHRKHGITNGPAFLGCGYQWADVQVLAASAINVIPSGADLPTAAACLAIREEQRREEQKPGGNYAGKPVKSADNAAVYFVSKSGSKHWIMREEVFVGCGFQWAGVETLSKSTLDALPNGVQLQTASACQALRRQ